MKGLNSLRVPEVFGDAPDHPLGGTSMDAVELKQRAREGDPRAIATRLSQNVLLSDLALKAGIKGNSLHLLLEAPYLPQQETIVPVIKEAVQELALVRPIHTLVIYGRGASTTSWKVMVPLTDDLTDIAFEDPFAVTLTPPPSQDHPETAPVLPRKEVTPSPLEKIDSSTSTAGAIRLQNGAKSGKAGRSRKSNAAFELSWQDVRRLLQKFDPLKAGFITCLAVYGLFGAKNYTVEGYLEGSDRVMHFIHGANLIFHEAGHIFFAILGQFMGVFGGSLFQILLPACLVVYFWITRQLFAAAVTACWTGQNFWDVSIYVKDAQSLVLPLLGGDNGFHDWNFLLDELNWLAQDQLVGNFIFWVGWLIYAGAIALGIYYARLPQPKSTQD